MTFYFLSHTHTHTCTRTTLLCFMGTLHRHDFLSRPKLYSLLPVHRNLFAWLYDLWTLHNRTTPTARCAECALKQRTDAEFRSAHVRLQLCTALHPLCSRVQNSCQVKLPLFI